MLINLIITVSGNVFWSGLLNPTFSTSSLTLYSSLLVFYLNVFIVHESFQYYPSTAPTCKIWKKWHKKVIMKISVQLNYQGNLQYHVIWLILRLWQGGKKIFYGFVLC